MTRNRTALILQALPLVCLTPVFLSARLDAAGGAPLPAAARAAAEAVDSLRIEQTVRSLAEDSSGEPVSRYAERPETFDLYAPRIRSLLAAAIGPEDSSAIVPFVSERTDAPQANVIARMRASGPSQGLVLLTAHYDATGRRATGWNGLTDPAPGADDNASGIAALVEAAYALAPLDLPFDVELVAFGSEEAYGPASAAPLEGSRVYAGALRASGELLLGVINCDMIAYNPIGRKIDVVTNTASDWIQELYASAAAGVSPSLRVERVLSNASTNSDHASFWAVGEDAVLLIENEFPDLHNPLYPGNPFYHTPDDTVGNLDFGMAAEVTRAAVAAVAALAEDRTGVPAELFVDSAHVLVSPRKLFVGDEAAVEVRVFNRGGPIDPARLPITVTIDEPSPPAGSAPLPSLSGTISDPIAPYFYKRVVFHWRVEDEHEGRRALRVRAAFSDGSGSAETTVHGTIRKNVVTAVRAINSPSRLDDPSNRLRFEFQVPLRPGVPQDVEALAYDVAGRLIARHPAEPAQDGKNFLFWDNFKPEGDPPGSGVYAVEIHLLDRASRAILSTGSGKFLIVR